MTTTYDIKEIQDVELSKQSGVDIKIKQKGNLIIDGIESPFKCKIIKINFERALIVNEPLFANNFLGKKCLLKIPVCDYYVQLYCKFGPSSHNLLSMRYINSYKDISTNINTLRKNYKSELWRLENYQAIANMASIQNTNIVKHVDNHNKLGPVFIARNKQLNKFKVFNILELEHEDEMSNLLTNNSHTV